MSELRSFYCEVIITSDTSTPDQISAIVNCKPGRSYYKGEIFELKSSGSTSKRVQNLWAVSTKESNDEYISLSHCLENIIKLFGNRLEGLKELKASPDFEVVLWIWIKGHNNGLGLEIPETYLRFVNENFNRLNFSIVN
jgi:hypothetical protein